MLFKLGQQLVYSGFIVILGFLLSAINAVRKARGTSDSELRVWLIAERICLYGGGTLLFLYFASFMIQPLRK